MLPTPDSSTEVGSLRKDEEKAMLPAPDSSTEVGNLRKDEERAMLPAPDSSTEVGSLRKDEEKAMLPAHDSSTEVGNLCKDEEEEESGNFLTNFMPEVGVVGVSHVTDPGLKRRGRELGKRDNEYFPFSRCVTDGGDPTPGEDGTLPSPSGVSPQVSANGARKEGSASPSTEQKDEPSPTGQKDEPSPTGQKDEPGVSLALVPLTETASSFLTSITHTSPPCNLLTGDDICPRELQSGVGSTATQSSVPAKHLSEEHPSKELSEEGGGGRGEGADVEYRAGGVVIAGHKEEEQREKQQATFPCLPPDPVRVSDGAVVI